MHALDQEEETPRVTVDGVEFNKYSSLVISSLITKRRDETGRLISEKVDVVSQENPNKKEAFSVLVSKKSPKVVAVTITSPEGVDTVAINTRFTPCKIYSILKHSSKMDLFSLRIASTAEEDNLPSPLKKQAWFFQ